MTGLYLHIPFCKQACHYCDFHFSTRQDTRSAMIGAMIREMDLRKHYLDEPLETIYFGGGTPSILSNDEWQKLYDAIHKHFTLAPSLEITLEANPDDISKEKLTTWKTIGVNRLSIGIQTFHDSLLTYLNRAHSGAEARTAVHLAAEFGFTNLNADLMFAIPTQTEKQLHEDLAQLLTLPIQHVSLYGCTIEPQTVFGVWKKRGRLNEISDNDWRTHYNCVMNELTAHGFLQYEISNFALPNFYSRHNTNYWLQKKYIGIGPGAHSFNGNSRQFNLENNPLYIRQIQAGTIPATHETLTPHNQQNEYVMTSLRSFGLTNHELKIEKESLLHILQQMVEQQFVKKENDTWHLTHEGKFVADSLIEKLMV